VTWAIATYSTTKLVISRRSFGGGHSKGSMHIKSETCEASDKSFGVFNIQRSEAKLEECLTPANTATKGLNIVSQHKIQKVEDLLHL
jgi:hypothetical protein